MSPELPAVLFLDDLARVLRTSRRTLEKLRRHRALPIPELQSIDRRPRWSGEAVRRYLEGQRASGSSLRAVAGRR